MKILLVEDNPILWKSIVRFLKQQSITVEHIKNWTDAEIFWQINNKDIDLVILDIMLPWKTWIEICKTIRKKGISTPVLMLTAMWELQDKILWFKTWADDYLVKPFEFEELFMRIQALLRRPKTIEKQIIDLPYDIKVDLSWVSISKKWEDISLTPKEFSILEYLIHNKNIAISQQKIYDNVFDFAKDNWSNTIEVHIKNLRKKLFWNHGKKIIKTVRWVGYKLEI